MSFNKIPDVCLKEIFIFVNDFVDIRMMQATSSFFNENFPKALIDTYIANRKALIQKYFPPLVVSMVGGYNQFLHYPVITNFTIRPNFRHFSYENDYIPSPTFQEMKYPVMIGVYNEHAFISVIIKSTRHYAPGNRPPDRYQESSVLTMYSSAMSASPEWRTNNNFLSTSFSPNILGYGTNGLFSILNKDFYNKIKNILTYENNRKSLSWNTTYDNYIRFEVPHIPQYNKPLIFTCP